MPKSAIFTSVFVSFHMFVFEIVNEMKWPALGENGLMICWHEHRGSQLLEDASVVV